MEKTGCIMWKSREKPFKIRFYVKKLKKCEKKGIEKVRENMIMYVKSCESLRKSEKVWEDMRKYDVVS